MPLRYEQSDASDERLSAGNTSAIVRRNNGTDTARLKDRFRKPGLRVISIYPDYNQIIIHIHLLYFKAGGRHAVYGVYPASPLTLLR